jgi:hypothetical protein
MMLSIMIEYFMNIYYMKKHLMYIYSIDSG